MNEFTPRSNDLQHSPHRATAVNGSAPDPYRGTAVVLVAGFLFTLPAIVFWLAAVRPVPPPDRWAAAAEILGVEPNVILLGEITYAGSCALCHGPTADGVPRLGKPLRNSAYVRNHNDAELLSLITTGRLPSDPANTTGAAMPARGGRGLPDEDLRGVIAYLRALQDPTKPTVSLEEWLVRTGGSAAGEQAMSLVGSSAGVGHDTFLAACSSCHGTQGQGIEGLGKALDRSTFVASKSDDELIAFVKRGRPSWDPDNTTGLDMPSKGGNPALTDEQLGVIVKYIRSIHE
ncbi:MAG: cytochrome c [Planctomycetota bacterium]